MDRTSRCSSPRRSAALIALQAPINSALGKVGTFQATTVYFASGWRCCSRSSPSRAAGTAGLGDIGEAPWVSLLGGACGVAIVSASIVGVGPLGAGGVTAAVVAGQLTASVVIDRFGLFGVDKQGDHGVPSWPASRCCWRASR